MIGWIRDLADTLAEMADDEETTALAGHDDEAE